MNRIIIINGEVFDVTEDEYKHWLKTGKLPKINLENNLSA